MDPMGIIGWIIVGIIAGWIAEQVTGRRHGLITNLIVGIIGAFIGGWLANTLNIQFLDSALFNNLIIATLGAIILLLLFGLIRRR